MGKQKSYFACLAKEGSDDFKSLVTEDGFLSKPAAKIKDSGCLSYTAWFTCENWVRLHGKLDESRPWIIMIIVKIITILNRRNET